MRDPFDAFGGDPFGMDMNMGMGGGSKNGGSRK